MSLDMAAILAADDLPRERVAVPEWGGEVWIRTLTGAERAAFEMENVRRRKAAKDDDSWFADYGVRLLALSLCREDGTALVTDAGQVEALGRKAAPVLDRLADVALRLNALRAKDQEQAEGNSERTPSPERGSVSLSLSGSPIPGSFNGS